MNLKFILRKVLLLPITFLLIGLQSQAQQPDVTIRKKDRKKDIEMVTSEGVIRLRLSDSTPIHRDNFLKLVKSNYYNNISFHRVIPQFMIQAGDPNTRGDSLALQGKKKDSLYTLPAEFRQGLFHKRGALGAGRKPDVVNPQKASSANQFYIVQGRTFTDSGLDSVEMFELKGRKLPAEHRAVYKSIGGAPHLDQNYSVFGEVISGMEVVDRIASRPTSGRSGGDKPLQDIKIKETRLVSRRK